jgi:hypothetical protein
MKVSGHAEGGTMTKKKSPNIFSGKNAKIIPAPVRPVGHPATILYKKLPDDMILITGFGGFLSLDEILDRYGRVVAVAYTAYPYYMAGDTRGVIVSGVVGGMRLTVGQLHSKDGFSKIIAHVKKCGGLLHDIIAAVNGGEVKRIEI